MKPRIAIYAEPTRPSTNVVSARVILHCDCGWGSIWGSGEWFDDLQTEVEGHLQEAHDDD